MKNCYIHIPFCRKICSYCDFCKMYYDEELVDRYLDSLETEINSIYKGEPLETIYIGGGTPSCLNKRQLKKLFEIINVFKKSKDLEFTIEGNFESTDLDKLKLYKEYGINRLSFGLESINEENLELLNRKIDKNIVSEVINNCKTLDLNNINIDLIYAVPGESIKVLKKDLEYLFSLDISHISTYSLIIEDHTILGINKTRNISEDLDYDMYKLICKEMKKHNYLHYEISNFSKDGYFSKHNLCYWNNDNYYGFGLGAASYISNKRITNTKSITKYLNREYVYLSEELNLDEVIEYEIILNLRKRDGVLLEKFRKRYGFDLLDRYNFKKLIDDNLLMIEDNKLLIPEEKWYISNEIIIKILECMNNG